MKQILNNFKLNPSSLYIIKAGFVLMLVLYCCAAAVWLLLGTAADLPGMTLTLSGLIEAAPASFGAAVAAALVCDLWYKERGGE